MNKILQIFSTVLIFSNYLWGQSIQKDFLNLHWKGPVPFVEKYKKTVKLCDFVQTNLQGNHIVSKKRAIVILPFINCEKRVDTLIGFINDKSIYYKTVYEIYDFLPENEKKLVIKKIKKELKRSKNRRFFEKSAKFLLSKGY